MEEQILTVEQCRELIEKFGLDMSDASMCWVINLNSEDSDWKFMIEVNSETTKDFYKDFPGVEVILTYTLADILKKLPKDIDYYPFKVQVYGGSYNVLNFGYWKGERAGWLHFCQDMNSTINSAFELLKWCLENKHL